MLLDYVWDHRFPNEKDHFMSKEQKEKLLRIWKRNERMLQEHREGSSALDLSRKHGLSVNWTRLILKREKLLQQALSSAPKEKVTVSDIGPFRYRTRRCLENDNLLHMPIEEFYQSQNAQSLLRIPNFGKRSLHEIAMCLKQEGYDIARFTLPQPSSSWIGKDPVQYLKRPGTG
jgi:DNA-directed RNA polymerase alpha subunit